MIQNNLQELRATVKKGGEFDAWDLSSTTDLFNKVRLSLLIEEHGSGKQYLRLKCRTTFSNLATVLISISVAAVAFAWLESNHVLALSLVMATLVLVIRILHGRYTAKSTIWVAWKKLGEEKLTNGSRQRKVILNNSYNIVDNDSAPLFQHELIKP